MNVVNNRSNLKLPYSITVHDMEDYIIVLPQTVNLLKTALK